MNYEPKPSMLNPTIPQVDSEEIVEYEEIDDADIIELVGVEPTFEEPLDQRLLVSGNGRNTSIDKLEYQFEFLSDTLKQMSEQVAQVHQFFEDIKDRVDISLKRPPASKLQSPRAKGQFWIQFPLTTMEQVHDVEQRISTDYTYKRHLTTKLQKMKRVNPDCKIKKLLSSEVAAKFKCRTLWGIKIADSPFMMLVANAWSTENKPYPLFVSSIQQQCAAASNQIKCRRWRLNQKGSRVE